MDDDLDSDARLQQFWELTQRYAKVGDLDVVMGKQWSEAVLPPAWSLGDSPELADQVVEAVLTGRKTATTGLYEEYTKAEAETPSVGDLSILLDGHGHPRALLRTVEVRVLPFSEVTAKQAAAEGDGDGTVDTWRTEHKALWQAQEVDIDDTTDIVWERFKVLYPKGTRSGRR